ncbi:MAG: DMT family transporter [Elusimicrobiota bacterium]
MEPAADNAWTRSLRGIGYSLIVLVCGAGIFILGKEGVARVALPEFFFYWYLAAQIGFIPLSILRPRAAPWSFSRRKAGWVAVFVLFEVTAAVLFFFGLRHVSSSMASFISQSHVFYVLLFGILILRERFAVGEAAGAALIVLGLGMIAYTSEGAGIAGLTLLLISNGVWGLNQVVVKRLLESEEPMALANLRNWALLLVPCAIFLARGRGPSLPPWEHLGILIAGGIVGPFFHITVRFKAIQAIEVSKVALITAQHPVLVLAAAAALGSELPGALKLAGGFAALAGSCLLVSSGLRRAQTGAH